METIRLEGLAIGYRNKNGAAKVVFENINASIHSGKMTCLIGKNGVGKSTLLRTLAAFQPPLGGMVLLNGEDIHALSPQERAKTISVVLTDKPDILNMKAEELVGLGRSPYTNFWGSLSQHDHEMAEKAMQQVGIEALKTHPFHALSDGERQKVMIAKALAQETPIILLDEPTAFLDYPSKVDILQLLRKLAHELDKTIFLSTHDLELALHIADTIWLLDKQKGLITGTAEELNAQGLIRQFVNRDEIYDKIYETLFNNGKHVTDGAVKRSRVFEFQRT
ncbi:MAG: ABC transporter ATP-binding protein [Prevotella sp.]|nr:ABC transporter ATP-binding protein [Prevotella sp.]